MSADRYEIIYREKPEFVTAECSIEIRFGNRSLHLFSGCSFLETHIAGAIRQQARDIAELRAERDQLRADLPAAEMDGVKLNNRYRVMMLSLDLPVAELRQMASRIAAKGDYEIAELKHECRNIEQESQAERGQLRSDLAAAIAARANMDTDRLEWMSRAEQAEARLAAIENAPTLCWQDVHDPSDLYWRRPDPAQVDTRELIARPAKD